MRIGDLSQASGVSVRMLRYYEEQGLLEAMRGPGRQRIYADRAVVVVGQIRTLLTAGLPTKTIRQLMPCMLGDGPEVDSCVLDLLHEQLVELESRIGELQSARNSLSGLILASKAAT